MENIGIDDGSHPSNFASSSSSRPQLPPQAQQHHSSSSSSSDPFGQGIKNQETFSRALEDLFGASGEEDWMEGEELSSSFTTFPQPNPSPPQSYPIASSSSSKSNPTFPAQSQIFDTFPPTLYPPTSQQNPTPPLHFPSPPAPSPTFGGFTLPSENCTTVDPTLRSHLLGLFFPRARNFRLTLHIPRFIA